MPPRAAGTKPLIWRKAPELLRVFGYATYRERLPMQTTATLIDFIPILDIAIFLGVPVLLLIVVFVQECLGRHRPEVRRIGDGRFST